VSLTAPESSLAATGGAAAVTVTTQPECAWTASSEVGWIGDLGPTSGQGNGAVQFRVSPNPDGTPREAAIVINDHPAMVRQDASACRFELTSSNGPFAVDGGTGTVEVSAPRGCEWAASSSDNWIVIASPDFGSGPGRVSFRVAVNDGSGRTGTIVIGGASVAVSQEAVVVVDPPVVVVNPPGPTPAPPPPSGNPPACTPSVQPTAASMGPAGGSGAFTIATAAGCSWTVTSLVPWITVNTAASGTGSATIAFAVAVNGGSTRIGTLDVSGQTITVTQAGVPGPCPVAIDRTSHSVAAEATNGVTVAVFAAVDCAWTAASHAAWLTIASGAGGSGNGTVAFNAAANAGGARSGTLTIGGKTFTVNQAAACLYAINPSTQSISAAGGAGSSVAVSTAAGCAWTATRNAAWLTIAAGASGSGNGSVAFSVAANSGSARTGTLTIAGHAFTVLQGGACTYSINPTSHTIGRKGGKGPNIAVSAPAGCSWTAASNDGWLTITSGASGTGNDTVKFQVASFSGSSRTGTLTIAGRTFTVTQAKKGDDDDDDEDEDDDD
jgi:hypothetical protein